MLKRNQALYRTFSDTMKKKFLYISFFLSIQFCFGQDIVQEIELSPENEAQGYFFSEWIKIKRQGAAVRSFSAELINDADMEYRIGQKDGWKVLTPNLHPNGEKNSNFGELIFWNSDSLQIRGKSSGKFLVHFYNVTLSKYHKQNNETFSCRCDSVLVRSRAQWCPNGDCPLDPTPDLNDVKFLILHHTASGNDAEDYDAVVRSYYRFHVETRGWDDIGYNFLISPDGIVYEGRGEKILGAHFCSKNTGTLGIGMIGDYSAREPSDTMIASAESLVAYLACFNHINILENSYHESSELWLNHLSGHRDGCVTSCPGDQAYLRLPLMIDKIASIQEEQCFIEPLSLQVLENSGIFSLSRNNQNYEDALYLDILFSEDPSTDFLLLDSVTPSTLTYDLGSDPQPGWYQIRLRFSDEYLLCSNSVLIDFSSIEEWFDRMPPDFQIGLYDSSGRRFNQGNKEVIEIAVQGLNSGIYYLHDGYRTIKILR